MRQRKGFDRFLEAGVVGQAQDWTCDDLAASQTSPQSGLSGFRLLTAGDEAFLARAFLIARAQRTLDLQYYLFRGDATGALLSATILQAADRGVRVRLLVDGGALMWRDSQSALLSTHPNVEIRLFNPVAGSTGGALAGLVRVLSNPRRLNRRMHNKVFIADGRFVVIGGRNLSDRYFGMSTDFGFRDMDVICTGALVADIATSFDAYWNSDSARTLRSVGVRNRSAAEFARFRNGLAQLRRRRRISDFEKQLAQTRLAEQFSRGDLELTWARAHLIVDLPEKVSGAIAQGPSPLEQLVELAQSASRELLLVSPYFVPGERGMAVLARLCERGIRVLLVTNSLASTDVVAVHTAYRRYRPRLLEIGVEIREIKPFSASDVPLAKLFGHGRGSLHAKAYIFDQTHVVIGSLNLDPRSMILNTEIGVLISSVPFASEVHESLCVLGSDDYSYRVARHGGGDGLVWEENASGRLTQYRSEPLAGWWRRVAVFLLSWLPIEDQL